MRMGNDSLNLWAKFNTGWPAHPKHSATTC